jgi:hypothetical protein
VEYVGRGDGPVHVVHRFVVPQLVIEANQLPIGTKTFEHLIRGLIPEVVDRNDVLEFNGTKQAV